MPPMCVMRLLKSERLVRLVRFSSPEISEMLLNERSSHSRLERWPRFSIFSMMLLSSCSLTRRSKPIRLSILRMFLNEKIRQFTSGNGVLAAASLAFWASCGSPVCCAAVRRTLMHRRQSSSSMTVGSMSVARRSRHCASGGSL